MHRAVDGIYRVQPDLLLFPQAVIASARRIYTSSAYNGLSQLRRCHFSVTALRRFLKYNTCRFKRNAARHSRIGDDGLIDIIADARDRETRRFLEDICCATPIADEEDRAERRYIYYFGMRGHSDWQARYAAGGRRISEYTAFRRLKYTCSRLLHC